MFEFASPWYLLLALMMPLVVWWWLRRRRRALRFPMAPWMSGIQSVRVVTARWAGACLRGGAFLMIILALAGPRWPDLRTRIPTQGIALEMLVDVSGSMAERDFQWEGRTVTRLEAVKEVFELFVKGGSGPGGEVLPGRPDDLIGLVTFATRPESPCPLTLTHSVLLRILKDEQPRTIPTEQTTNIGDAIAWGLHRLESAEDKRRVIVLLTDGEHNVPPPALTPRQAAQLVANQGRPIPIYAIDAGGEGGTLEEEPGNETGPAARAKVRAAAQESLQAVAQITGGRYFHARDTDELLKACQEIDRLERKEIRSFQYRRYHELFPWFGLAAFCLLVAVQGLEMTTLRRLP